MSEKSSFRVSRRSLLKGSALVAGAAALGFKGIFGDYSQAYAAPVEGDDVKTMLNLAATAEAFAITHYYNVLTTKRISFNAEQISQLKGALDSEVDHLKFLQANGGNPVVSQFYVPFKVWTDIDTFVTVTEQGELIFIGAYLAAVRRFAELNQPLLAATAAQTVGVEAEHRALIREMGGKRGNFQSILTAQFYNVSDAVPQLTPFLKGGPGYDGPAPLPSFDAVAALVGSDGVIPVLPFTDPNVLKATPVPIRPADSVATMAATMEATAAQ